MVPECLPRDLSLGAHSVICVFHEKLTVVSSKFEIQRRSKHLFLMQLRSATENATDLRVPSSACCLHL